MAENTSATSAAKETRAVQRLRSAKGETGVVGGTRDFLHFLLDYDIVSFTISFIVAQAVYKVVSDSVPVMVRGLLTLIRMPRLETMNGLVESSISLVIVLLLCFVFIQFVFQPLVTSGSIAEERRLRELVKTAEEKSLEKQAETATTQPSVPTQQSLSFLDPSGPMF